MPVFDINIQLTEAELALIRLADKFREAQEEANNASIFDELRWVAMSADKHSPWSLAEQAIRNILYTMFDSTTVDKIVELMYDNGSSIEYNIKENAAVIVRGSWF